MNEWDVFIVLWCLCLFIPLFMWCFMIFKAYSMSDEERKRAGNGVPVDMSAMRQHNAENDQRRHNEKMERIAQERLDLAQRDFVISGNGKKRNLY